MLQMNRHLVDSFIMSLCLVGETESHVQTGERLNESKTGIERRTWTERETEVGGLVSGGWMSRGARGSSHVA